MIVVSVIFAVSPMVTRKASVISMVDGMRLGTVMGRVGASMSVVLLASVVKIDGRRNIPCRVEHTDHVAAHVVHGAGGKAGVDEIEGRLST
jgi:hypothetical protein